MHITGLVFLILSGAGWLHQRLLGHTWDWSQLIGWHHEPLIIITLIIGLALLGVGWTVQEDPVT